MFSREMLQDFYANFARNFENLKYAIELGKNNAISLMLEKKIVYQFATKFVYICA